MEVGELRQVYEGKRQEIRDRLAEFEKIGRTASDERLFEELTFCIYTAGASARMGLRCVESVRPVLMTGSLQDIQHALQHKHRWPDGRGAYVYETREYLREYCGLRMRKLLSGFATADERRDFFAANRGVRGLGYKEASHFLRNIGYRGYAILDKHILARLAEFGVIESPKPPSTRKRYFEKEEKMKQFAETVGIDFDELDLLLWFTKTGEILK
ncbi:MAG TPA: N-glycosylase/DNA lyase [Blastocatellia bacterium]|nr:N-glycosylase/DNA lyase [Blastocatellia bacterium]